MDIDTVIQGDAAQVLAGFEEGGVEYLSLFSGIGGFDLGLERAGMRCSAQVEIDDSCHNVLEQHFPNVPKYKDVKDVGKYNLPAVDLICGGFPCQDLSVAGKRAGLVGERSGLWFEFARIIDELEPRWVVIENVPGLLSSNKGKDFAIIISWLAERGYGVAWRILDAQYFGVPQRRRRVFIVGSFGSGSCVKVLFEREGMSGNTPPSREVGTEIAPTLATGSNKGRNNPDSEAFAISGMAEYKEGIGVLRAHEGDYGGGSEILVGFTPRRTNWDGVEDKSPTLNAGSGGMSAPAVFGVSVLGHTQSNGLGVYEQDQANTLEAMNSTNQAIGSFGVHRLTPVECERLQGFPDGWTEYSLNNGNRVIINSCLKTFAQFLNVDEKWLTVNWESVSCTTRDTKNTGQRICLRDTTQQTTNAKSVIGWLEKMEPGDYAQGITNHGSVMVMQDNQTGIWKSKPISKQDDRRYTGLSWKISLEGNYDQENLSIILIWMKQMTHLKTSIFAKTEMNTERFMILWNAPQSNYSKAENWSLRMDDIEFQSDSARYSQLGNAVAVPVAEWIGRRIVDFERKRVLTARTPLPGME